MTGVNSNLSHSLSPVAVDAERHRLLEAAVAGGAALVLAACTPTDPAPDLPRQTTFKQTQTIPMTINQHVDTYRGKPVVDFRRGDSPAEGDVIYRLYQEYDTEESQTQLIEYFFSQVDPGSIETLIIGPWQVSHDDDPGDLLDALIARKAEPHRLRALYVGDIT